MQNSRTLLIFIQIVFVVSILYGVSAEAFRNFDAHEPAFPAEDAAYYLRMAQGDYDVWFMARNRPIIPWLASIVSSILPKTAGLFSGPEMDKVDQLKRGFYVVNYAIMVCTGVFFIQLLLTLGFNQAWAYLGTALFLSSGVISYTTAYPMVDSGYYLAITLIVLWLIEKRVHLLWFIAPLLVIFKETLVLFLLLPYIDSPRNWSNLVPFALGLLVLVSWRGMIFTLFGPPMAGPPSLDIVMAIQTHLEFITGSLNKFLTPLGIKEVLQSFGLLFYLVPVGIYLNFKKKLVRVPAFFLWMFPIGFGFALLSSHLGRMLFSAFPALVVYILVVLKYVTNLPGAVCSAD